MKAKIFIIQLLLQIAMGAHAQIITGVIKGKNEAPIVGATITAKLAGQVKARAYSYSNGHYSLKLAYPGTYSITITHKGMKTTVILGVPASDSRETRLTALLQPGISKTQNGTLVSHYKEVTINPAGTPEKANTPKRIPVTTEVPLSYHYREGYPYRICGGDGGLSIDGGRQSGNVYIIDGQPSPDSISCTTNGGLTGAVYSNAGPLNNAVISLYKNGVAVANTVTNYGGSFLLQGLDTGIYKAAITCRGMQRRYLTLTVVPGESRAALNISLRENITIDRCRISPSPITLLLDPYQANYILWHAGINHMPTTNNTSRATFAPGIYQWRSSAALSCDGGRATGNLYVVDGQFIMTGQ